MEEIEVPTEHLHEAIHHEAHHSQDNWITAVALSTALLAALAAVAALLSGMNANEAVIERVTASDLWSEFQANGIKLAILQGNAELLKMNGKPVPEAFQAKIDKYNKEKNRTSKAATEKEQTYEARLSRHEKLAMGVTTFQIAIAIAAIAVLTKRRWFWYLGLAFGAAGIGCLIYALAFSSVGEESTETKPEQKEGNDKSKDAKPSKSESGGTEKSSKEVKEATEKTNDGKQPKTESKSGAGLIAPHAIRLAAANLEMPPAYCCFDVALASSLATCHLPLTTVSPPLVPVC
ncbi:MAG TPA: DUF4337 family protein [Pirellulales bacterium]|jgi:hypothetical protein|nr:DUF4337 family protein [Pirellulales bacterium]